MEFRKMVTITLYVRQQKRHRCIEVFWILWEKAKVGLFERISLNIMYIIICETDCQSRFDAWRVLRVGALG